MVDRINDSDGWIMGSNLGFTVYEPRKGPDGFRGIKWGTDISTLKDMRYIKTSLQGTKIYSRKNDTLHIGRVKLERIEYYFSEGEFSDVCILTKGYTNWTRLEEAVFEKFGFDYQDNDYIEDYFWSGGITEMSLQYNEISKKGEFWMSWV